MQKINLIWQEEMQPIQLNLLFVIKNRFHMLLKCLFISFFFFQFTLIQAQFHPHLEINDLCVAINGDQVQYIPETLIRLENGSHNEVRLYEQKNLVFGMVFDLKENRKRIKIVQRTFVENVLGKRFYSRKNVMTIYKDLSYEDLVCGQTREHLTYDPVLQKRIFASFNYHLIY